MAQARDNTELQPQKYFGAYRGTVTGFDAETGDCSVDVGGIAHTGMKAQVVQMMGGGNSASGFRQFPKIGAQCIIIFEQGDVRAPKIIGYFDSKQTGTAGLSQGDISMRTDTGVGFSLDEAKNSARIHNAEGYGLTASKGELSINHRIYNLQSTPDFTRLQLNGNVTHFYSSDGQVMETMQKSTIVDTVHNHKSTERVDEVTGDFNLRSMNNLKLNASQLHGVASEEINFTARNDFAMMSKTFSSTQNTDIFFSSNLGDFQVAVTAGEIILAAGAAATADTGVTVFTAQVSLNTLGMIEIDNLTANTKWNPGGQIEETATLGMKGTYGASGLDIKSAGLVSIDSAGPITIDGKLTVDVKSIGPLTIDSKSTIDIRSALAMNIHSELTMLIDSSAGLTLQSPLMTFRPALPIVGVQVITLLGPQPIIPG